MKSLKNVQVIAKVIKILSMIAFVASIVACAFCLIGIPVVAIVGNNPQIMKYIVNLGGEYNKNEALCSCICGVVSTGFMIALYACVVCFYKKELQIGTPFNSEVVNKSRLIGWLHIFLSLGASIVVGIISACFKVDSTDLLVETNIVIGVIYLLISFVFAYGCDLKNELPAKSDESIVAKNESNSATMEQATEKAQSDKDVK